MVKAEEEWREGNHEANAVVCMSPVRTGSISSRSGGARVKHVLSLFPLPGGQLGGRPSLSKAQGTLARSGIILDCCILPGPSPPLQPTSWCSVPEPLRPSSSNLWLSGLLHQRTS